MTPFAEAVYRLVRDIPPGKVMTYGQVATVVGHPRGARAAGQAMLVCGNVEPAVPWQRVINARGQISHGGDPHRPELQRRLLEAEGLVFDASDCVCLETYRWEPVEPEQYHFDSHHELPF